MLNAWLKTSQSTSKEHLKHEDLIISGKQKPLSDSRKARPADTSAKLQKSIFMQVKHENRLSENLNLHKLGGTQLQPIAKTEWTKSSLLRTFLASHFLHVDLATHQPIQKISQQLHIAP